MGGGPELKLEEAVKRWWNVTVSWLEPINNLWSSKHLCASHCMWWARFAIQRVQHGVYMWDGKQIMDKQPLLWASKSIIYCFFLHTQGTLRSMHARCRYFLVRAKHVRWLDPLLPFYLPLFSLRKTKFSQPSTKPRKCSQGRAAYKQCTMLVQHGAKSIKMLCLTIHHFHTRQYTSRLIARL